MLTGCHNFCPKAKIPPTPFFYFNLISCITLCLYRAINISLLRSFVSFFYLSIFLIAKPAKFSPLSRSPSRFPNTLKVCSSSLFIIQFNISIFRLLQTRHALSLRLATLSAYLEGLQNLQGKLVLPSSIIRHRSSVIKHLSTFHLSPFSLISINQPNLSVLE